MIGHDSCTSWATARVLALAVDQNGRTAISGNDDGTVRVWDLETETCLARFPCEAAVRAVGRARGKAPIVAGLSDGRVLFFEIKPAWEV